MCGILGVVSQTPANQLLYDGLASLAASRSGCRRHRDAGQASTFHLHKGNGLVRDVFRTRNMRALLGNCGHRACALSHRRFCGDQPTKRSRSM